MLAVGITRLAGFRDNDDRAVGSLCFFAALAMCAAANLGCAREDLPQLLPVEGTVTLGGKPLDDGSVSYRASDASGDPRFSPTGRIEAGGTYKLFIRQHAGCPSGKWKVVVFANEPARAGQGNAGLPRSIIDRRYNDAATTPLAVEVREGALPGDYDLRIDK